MYSYRKRIIISSLLLSVLGTLISCDFIFENRNHNSPSKDQLIKDNQIENDYWVLLANDNLRVLQLCNTFLAKNTTISQNEIVGHLLNNHQTIKNEIKAVAEIKNISIPVTLINELPSNGLNSKNFHTEIKVLLTNQAVILDDIEKITTRETIKKSSHKIKDIILEDQMMVNRLLNFENNFTNL